MSEEIKVRFKLSDYERKGSHKVAISLPELVEQTNSFSTKNRPGCVPKLQKSSPKELFLQYNVKCTLSTSDPAGHEVRVRFDLSHITDEAKAKNLDIEAACTCPAFLYWGAQWNLHQRDALEGEPRPLLTAPTERLDLRNQFVICKHCKAVFERILPSVQHNIVNIVRQRHVDDYNRRQREKDEATRKNPDNATSTPTAPVVPAEKAPKRVIKRDTPATPEEQQVKPEIKPIETSEPPAQETVQSYPSKPKAETPSENAKSEPTKSVRPGKAPAPTKDVPPADQTKQEPKSPKKPVPATGK